MVRVLVCPINFPSRNMSLEREIQGNSGIVFAHNGMDGYICAVQNVQILLREYASENIIS